MTFVIPAAVWPVVVVSIVPERFKSSPPLPRSEVRETADPVIPAVPPEGPVNLTPTPEVKAVAEMSRAFSVSMELAVKLTASAAFEAWVISRTETAPVVFN